MSSTRRAGADLLRLLAAVDPPFIATDVDLYGKDVAGITQLFALIGDGTIFQMTPIVLPSAITTPARPLGVAFQPNVGRSTLAYYSVRIESELTLAGGARGRVELLSDAADPPTTIRARVAGGVTGTVVLGVDITDYVEAPLTYLVPPGHFVLLQSVDEVGTPIYTITTQTEQTF